MTPERWDALTQALAIASIWVGFGLTAMSHPGDPVLRWVAVCALLSTGGVLLYWRVRKAGER